MAAMNRREAVKATGALLSGVVLASSGMLAACGAEPRAKVDAATPMALSIEDQALMESIADTILPDTASSPGAKAAGAGAAINVLLADVYDVAARRRIADGLAALRKRSIGFTTLLRPDRESILRAIDVEAKAAGDSHWFHLMHELAVKAFFSSEVGMTKALRYVREPGRYNGCVKLTPGQPGWA